MSAQIVPALFLLQESGQPASGTDTTVKIVCGILAVVLIGIVILRRKSKKKKEEDEF